MDHDNVESARTKPILPKDAEEEELERMVFGDSAGFRQRIESFSFGTDVNMKAIPRRARVQNKSTLLILLMKICSSSSRAHHQLLSAQQHLLKSSNLKMSLTSQHGKTATMTA